MKTPSVALTIRLMQYSRIKTITTVKIKKTIWTIAICDYNVDDNCRLYLTSDVYMDEQEARERFEDAKKFLIGIAGEPEFEDGSFPGRKFVVKTSEQPDALECRIHFTAERVTDVPEEKYKGETDLAWEEVEIEIPLSAQITPDGYIKLATE